MVLRAAEAVDRAELPVSVAPAVVMLHTLDLLEGAVVMPHALGSVGEAVPAKGI